MQGNTKEGTVAAMGVPGGAAVVIDAAAEARWREWQARGAAADKRTAAGMRTLVLVLAAALAVAFVRELLLRA
jgi:hypothetical protein